jgi:hypothetical protein
MLVSASHLVEGESYTISGGNHCVTFVNQDIGNLLQSTLSRQKVFPSGTMDSEQLYHFNAPRHKDHPYLTTALSPKLKLEQLHCSLGHSNYHAMVHKGTITGITLSNQESSIPPPMYVSHVKRQYIIRLQVRVLQFESYQTPRSPSHHVWTEGVCQNTIHTLFLNG